MFIEVFINGKLHGSGFADMARNDLAEAKVGRGNHGFSLKTCASRRPRRRYRRYRSLRPLVTASAPHWWCPRSTTRSSRRTARGFLKWIDVRVACGPAATAMETACRGSTSSFIFRKAVGRDDKITSSPDEYGIGRIALLPSRTPGLLCKWRPKSILRHVLQQGHVNLITGHAPFGIQVRVPKNIAAISR